ncbi:MAG TPA: GntR family transcriptional regulator [Candidatus Lumbricidophila sp.]|nr:GntR family transcriptional regulator [Candidatus Lumbricidophila sp.]
MTEPPVGHGDDPLVALAGATAHSVIAHTRGRSRRSDYVYDTLSEAIRSIRMPPGTPLSEPAVAAALHVSRAPVREAFTRLADQGLVTTVPQVGSRVAPVSTAAVGDAVFIRESLETTALRQALARDDLDLSNLDAHVAANQAAFEAGDLEAYFESDEHFHHELFRLAGVPQIWDVLAGIKLQLDRLRRIYLPSAIENPLFCTEHQQIAHALHTRDEALGITVLHAHITRALNVLESLRETQPTYFQ